MKNNEYDIPYHVAIILDGNGRWAKKRGLKRSLGHKAGFENLKELSSYIFDKGVKILSVFAFSTENFKREKEEVDYLMDLLVTKFKTLIDKNKNIKIVFSGKKEDLSKEVINAINEIEEITKECDSKIFNICFNYGGKLDIVEATKKIVDDVGKGLIKKDDIDENLFGKYLYNSIPDIDLLIRTSGEFRISNFMLFQSAYSEMYFPKILFPDFKPKDFDKALEEYNKRDRRFGGIKKDK